MLTSPIIFPKLGLELDIGSRKVLLRGSIDRVDQLSDGSRAILDYKTDYVTEETLAERAAVYKGQLRSYAAAMERILKKPVKEAVLYFLAVDTPVPIKL